MNDESAPDGRSNSLYRVLTLTARPTLNHFCMTEALLIVAPIAYIRSSPLKLRPIWSQSWMIEALLTVTPIAYIESSAW